MAEIQQTNLHQSGNYKRKQLSTRVDLTPMVDLGFLLITFFIFTTQLSRPVAMKVNLPVESTEPSLVGTSMLLTIIPMGENKLYYYAGDSLNKIQQTDYSSTGIRTVIERKRQMVKNQFGNANETTILIKATEFASFQNVVDLMDEMSISGVTRYMLLDANKQETAMLK